MSTSPAWPRVHAARHSASMLRLSALPAAAGAATWLAGLTRALRSAGPARDARPLHGVLAGGDYAPRERRAGR